MVDWYRLCGILRLAAVAGLVLFTAATAVATPPLQVGDGSHPPLAVASMGSGGGESVQRIVDGKTVWERDTEPSYLGVARLNATHLFVSYDGGAAVSCPPRLPEGCEVTGIKLVDTSGDRPTVEWDWRMPVRSSLNSEIHGVEVLPSGDLLVADMDRERIMEVEYPSKSVSWEWAASTFYESPGNLSRTDWLHINDVDRIGEERYLVSVRNANQLLIVERGTGVVEIINEDRDLNNDANCERPGQMRGGDDRDSRCGDPEILNHQHNPHWLGEGAVLVADSENDRVVELHEQPSGEWEVHWAVSGASGISFDWPRDADRLANGLTVVTDVGNRRAVAIAPNGSVAWSVAIPAQGFDADVRGGERLNASAVPTSPVTGSVGGASQQPFESIERIYGALRWALPLPYWLTSWHVLVLVVSGLVATWATVGRQIAVADTDDPPGEAPAMERNPHNDD